MSAVVQATCPGCKKVLRIPADWLGQAIRCKHCGMVLNAKPRAPAAKDPPKPPPAAPARPARAAAAPPAPAPVSYTDPEAGGSPFADLVDADAPVRRRGNRAAAVVLVGSLLLMVLTAGGVYVAVQRFANDPARAPAADEDGSAVRRPEAVRGPEAGRERGGAEPVRVPEEARETSVPFPRRALLITVHNYLFANPVGAGVPGAGSRNVAGLADKLSNGLRIPRNQIAHLSDAAGRGRARPPLRPVIEETLTRFLAASRGQDRVLVLFAGHAVESGEEAFLVPLEGELDRPETLIPLKWVYEQLAKCPARQKVLVLDVCRLDPVYGAERPGGEAMGPKLAAAVQSPPPGVQVWSACGPEQHSYETDNFGIGAFLGGMQLALEGASAGKLKLQDRIQAPDDPLPLVRLKEAVDHVIAREVGPLKLAQTTLLTGTPAESGPAFNAAEPPPPPPAVADGPPPLPPKKRQQLTKLLADVETPPVKASLHYSGIDFALLPAFDDKKLEEYLADPGKETELRKTVRQTQALLYALSGVLPPGPLGELAKATRKTLRADLSKLREGYPVPSNEAQFKTGVLNDERDVARIIARLGAAHEAMEGVADQRRAEPKRWQADYDFMLARLQEQIAYLYEYQSMLGQMRKELPPRDPELHGRWKLASTSALTGDSTGRKMAAASRKTLDRIIKEHAGTPWEVLAKREKLTALGLEWKPAR